MTRPVRVLVADDEAPARERLTSLLSGRADVQLVDACVSGPSALMSLERLRPDLVFLDVQMPGFSGLEVIRRSSRLVTPTVVFVTAFDHYAIAAFEAHAIDYLLKPFTDERFTESLERAISSSHGRALLELEPKLRALLASWPQEASARAQRPHTEQTDRLAIRAGGRIVMVATNSLRWVAADGDHVILHVAGDTIRTRRTLVAMRAQLDRDRFVQVNRAALIHIGAVSELICSSRGDDIVVLDDGTRVPVSRRFRPAVRRRLRISTPLSVVTTKTSA